MTSEFFLNVIDVISSIRIRLNSSNIIKKLEKKDRCFILTVTNPPLPPLNKYSHTKTEDTKYQKSRYDCGDKFI